MHHVEQHLSLFHLIEPKCPTGTGDGQQLAHPGKLKGGKLQKVQEEVS